jgi:fused signal recognition particle receptor
VQDEQAVAPPLDTVTKEEAPADIPTPSRPADVLPVHVEPPVSPPKPQAASLFQRLSLGLAKTKEALVYRMDALFLGKKVIDQELLDDLEEILITADLGVSTTQEVLEDARRKVKRHELSDPALLKKALKEKIRSFIMETDRPAELVMPESGPFVIMVVGVNGVGKTTTIGKIAHKFTQAGQSVLLVAADTFRAAAVAQLKIWGERNKVRVVSQQEGADPSAVVFDGMDVAIAKGYDVVIVDTAGRLHTQVNLMEELKKIKRVMGKKIAAAPHEVMLILDATTGQNAISQAKMFNATVDITGLTLTKLDGTAKGGIVVNICRELKIPIRFIGIGEQLEDLRDFDPSEFVEALFQENE